MSSLNAIGKPFIELLSVESTNNYAMGLIRAGMAQHGTAVFAHEQTGGKGQRNKHWTSQKNLNIAISVLIEPEKLNPTELFLLSMMAAVSVQSFFENYTGDKIKIKWPNDIYWRDRKAAGILIENVWQGSEWKFAVVGIGININQIDFGEIAPNAVSLKQITDKHFEPIVLAKKLCTVLEKEYQALLNDQQFIMEKYLSHLYKLNEKVKLKKDNRVFDAIIKGVSNNGELIIQNAIEEKFNVGEVEWVVNQ